MINIIFAGGRDFTNEYIALEIVIDAYKKGFISQFNELIGLSGKAIGADTTFSKVLSSNGVQVLEYPAKWNDLDAEPMQKATNKYGTPYNRLAGFNRNRLMADIGEKLVVAWNGSAGTKHMIETMIKRDKPVLVYNYEGKLVYEYKIGTNAVTALSEVHQVGQTF
jgi:hypothetical protein